jgi:hypothetical protein
MVSFFVNVLFICWLVRSYSKGIASGAGGRMFEPLVFLFIH